MIIDAGNAGVKMFEANLARDLTGLVRALEARVVYKYR
jgi:hypothetical protein